MHGELERTLPNVPIASLLVEMDRHTSFLDCFTHVGREVDAEVLAHISPARSSAVNYYGSITVDYDHELAQLDDQGHRPLRIVATDDL